MILARTVQTLAASLVLSACAVPWQQPAPSQLGATLHQLDLSSAKFTSAQATFENEMYTALVKEKETQKGITYTIRKGGSSEVGIKITDGGARTLEYKNGVARDYNPGLKCYDTYSAADKKGTIESLLALSFGASGTELSKTWIITDLGPETLNGVKLEKLDLVPRESGLKNNVTHLTLWTDLTRAVALKYIMYSPSGDTRTATYSNIQLNQKVDTAPFKIEGKPCGK